MLTEPVRPVICVWGKQICLYSYKCLIWPMGSYCKNVLLFVYVFYYNFNHIPPEMFFSSLTVVMVIIRTSHAAFCIFISQGCLQTRRAYLNARRWAGQRTSSRRLCAFHTWSRWTKVLWPFTACWTSSLNRRFLSEMETYCKISKVRVTLTP